MVLNKANLNVTKCLLRNICIFVCVYVYMHTHKDNMIMKELSEDDFVTINHLHKTLKLEQILVNKSDKSDH